MLFLLLTHVHSFDQLCINLANEQLHAYFNKVLFFLSAPCMLTWRQHIFKDELEAYASEGLDIIEV